MIRVLTVSIFILAAVSCGRKHKDSGDCGFECSAIEEKADGATEETSGKKSAIKSGSDKSVSNASLSFFQKITSSTPTFSQQFGNKVALSPDGKTMVVAGYRDAIDGTYLNSNVTGSIYVYTLKDSNWVLQQKLIAEGLNARVIGDNFGSSIAFSGSTIVVGAPGQDYDADGANYKQNAGAAYVFQLSGTKWQLSQKLVASEMDRNAGDAFGGQIAMDESTIMILTYSNLFIYRKLNSAWALQQKLNIDQGLESYPISLMAIAIHNGYAVLGASGALDNNGANEVSGAGAAYVLVEDANHQWSVSQRLIAEGLNARTPDSLFGYEVTIENDAIVVSAPQNKTDADGLNSYSAAGSVFIYTRSGSIWSFQQKLSAPAAIRDGGHFGASLSLKNSRLAIGANLERRAVASDALLVNAGAVFLYERAGVTWNLKNSFAALGTNGRNTQDQFGASVALSDESLVVGAPYQGYDADGVKSLGGAGAVFVFSN